MGSPCPLVSGSTVGKPSQETGGREAWVHFPRGHQADYAPQLKVTSSSRQPTLHESLILGFNNNFLLPPLRRPRLLAPGFCSIPVLFRVVSPHPICIFVESPFFKILFEFSYSEVPSVSLLNLWYHDRIQWCEHEVLNQGRKEREEKGREEGAWEEKTKKDW